MAALCCCIRDLEQVLEVIIKSFILAARRRDGRARVHMVDPAGSWSE